MSDAYDVRPAGSLKLKGTVTDGGIVKKQVHLSFIYFFTLLIALQEEEKVQGVKLQLGKGS